MLSKVSSLTSSSNSAWYHLCRSMMSSSHLPLRLNDLDYESLIIDQTTSPKKKTPDNELKFGVEFTDHMFEVDWDNDQGWHAPKIKPYSNFSIDPACSVFHYAMEAFEGLKAYMDDNDNIRLFRPQMNIQRLLSSCESLYFPTFDGDEFLDCLHELLRLDRGWIPRSDGYSLYIRPTVISTHANIALTPASNVKLYVILSPVPPYYGGAVSLLATDKYARAWPGGCGHKKLGSNYAPCIRPQMEAMNEGYTQIMWLSQHGNGDERYVTEVGTMNQFFLWINSDGEKELITAPLDGTILPGITRDSVLKLCREWNEFLVSERPYTIKDFICACNEGRILESFGSGTAAIISPVKRIGYQDVDYEIPLDVENPGNECGPLALRLKENILDIQYGRVSHEWSQIVPENIYKEV